jgi:antitoxin component HigA of HigAB toxin-antitoxin module
MQPVQMQQWLEHRKQVLQVPVVHRHKINNIMHLIEMFNPPVPGYQNIADDNSKPVWRTSRKTKLTLEHIRKLRKMLDVRNFEKKEYLKKVKEQYGIPAQPQQPTG